MTPRSDLVTLPPTAGVSEARKLMTERRIRHIPILNEEDSLVGIVSDRDLLAARGSTISTACDVDAGLCVSDIMTAPVKYVDPRLGVRNAAMSLRSLGIGCLAVMRDGILEGLVTDSDFVGVAINLLEQIENSDPSSQI
jgi:CBS domain-containing membrane protein